MRVLVAPLDWGLGHATRSIPVIRAFLNRGYAVDLAVSGRQAALFRGEFPQLTQIEIPGYSIRYPERGFEMPFWLLKNYGRIANVISEEHDIAEKLVADRGYDVLFSDNRFGFYSKKAKSVYMTHQARIAFPRPFSLVENIGIAWHRSQMKHFDRVWIPDFPEYPGMAGKLSHLDRNSDFDYVGLLSRFELTEPGSLDSKKYEFMAILSGPEPMRTSFEKKVLVALSKISGEHIVLLGRPGSMDLPQAPQNVKLFNHLESKDFAEVAKKSRVIISRPGYSTVMDMAALGVSSVFVPTPGQTEQEYLGKALFRINEAGLILQKDLDSDSLSKMAKEIRRIHLPESAENLLSLAMDKLT
ncbi:MAG: glycosyl transferase family 28 [Fibrobacteraceae bacterium]|nr:glycosyl transferase family 28 [Fibrobacteraceae bacterium]